MILITQEEFIELEKVLTPLIKRYGETEVLDEIEYIINWVIE